MNAVAGHRLWAPVYDDAPNPLLALETRLLAPRLRFIEGQAVLDAGCGTGRWMEWLNARGARVIGIDACAEMVLQMKSKPGLAGRAALADIRRIPLDDNALDLALCSFAMGYLPAVGPALAELGRVARRVIVTDLHPEAVRHGWTRSFRAGGERYELATTRYSLAELDEAAVAAGLKLQWRVEASLDEPEYVFFERAGKKAFFREARLVPAVVLSAWEKSSS